MHTLLEQEYKVTGVLTNPMLFLRDIFGFTKITASSYQTCSINNNGSISFYGRAATTTLGYDTKIFEFRDKNGNSYNLITKDDYIGSIFYHISEVESVKYFKYVSSADSGENSYTYILAEDANGEWVVLNGDKMYSDYGRTGIYNNPQTGRPELVDGGNQFLISKACRLDTGAEFKELYFVQSARSYTDTNCIVDYGGKTYRLVSVSNVKDGTGRYPAFAFPVSD